ncbi:MAG: hypothetical protein WC708_19005, partial [Lentisphaeria bacterium]
EALLLAAVATALFLAGVTEALSLFHALTRGALLASWGGLVAVLAAVLAAGLLWRRPERGPAATFRGWTLALLLPLQLILLTVAVIAVMAPPNNWDSMAYHMARVMHWIQNQGIGHYPTHCTRQVFMPPLAEWMILHLQLLSGGDHLANLVQWGALAGSVLGVSWIAKLLGAKAWGQAGADAWLAGGARRLGLVRPPETRNLWLQEAVTRCHQRLGWDVNDPATSWNARPYHLSLGWNHEDTAASPLHTLLALLALPLLAWPRWPEKVRAWGYVAAVAAGVALFAGALGWQEWHVRLMLPSLILAMPAAGLALEKALTPWGGIPVAALLLLAAVPYVVNNATRPLFGYDPEAEPPEPERILTARSIFRQPREAQYFSCRPDAYDSFVRVAESLADSRCARLGLQMGWNSWEYPLWVLTAARGGHPRIEHVGVTNETARLAERPPFRGFVPERRLYLYSLPGFRPQTPPRPRPD